MSERTEIEKKERELLLQTPVSCNDHTFLLFDVLHLKKNKFKDFPTNVIIKNLDRRSRFNTLQKAGMLQYFDEEFEDFKFPVNNEFFFLQVAYGSAFLSRQYQRSKSIELQKDS